MKAVSIYLATVLAGVLVVLAGTGGSARADDAQRLADINADLLAGKYAKAAEEVKALLAQATDKDTTLEARRILAECLRKQGDWRNASAAYTGLSRACPEGSEDRLRYQAVGEVLRAVNGEGVYVPAAAKDEKRNLSDDAALDAALAIWAEFQCKRFASVCGRVSRARTPADVVKVVQSAAEEARGIYLVAPKTSPEETRKIALAANKRLTQLCNAARGALEKKLHQYEPKMNAPWSFTNVEERDIEKTNQLCIQMATAEQVFMESVADLAGTAEWSQAESVRAACTDRQETYRELSKEFVVPEYIRIRY